MKKILLIVFCAVVALSSCFKQGNLDPNTAIDLSSDTLKLTVGQSAQLHSKNYSVNKLTWSPADSTIASVTTRGLVTGKSVGQTIINVASQGNAQTATCLVLVSPGPITGTVTQVPGVASDIGIGGDGSVYIIGIDDVSPTGGYSISKLTGNAFEKMFECAGTRISASPNGVPWVVNKSNLVYQFTGVNNLWQVQPGTATDIGIGADGSIFAIGTKTVSPTGGYDILKFNGAGWDTLQQCAGVHIAVSPQGIPWVVNKSHIVYKNTGGLLWQPIPGVKANDIGIGADGSVYVTSIDTTGTNPKPPIYKYNGNGWTPVSNASGVSIAVSPQGVPWWVDKNNSIFKLE